VFAPGSSQPYFQTRKHLSRKNTLAYLAVDSVKLKSFFTISSRELSTAIILDII
jgi:hypothetical protein